MHKPFFGLGATLLGAALCCASAPAALAQPLWDVIHVNMPYSAVVGDKTLPAGEYTIQQQRGTGGDDRVLLFYSDNGMKFDTSVMTNAALASKTPEDTSIVLDHVGDQYYYHKIWVQGKDYGYEIPLPANIRHREKELEASAVSVPATLTKPSTQPATTAQATQTQPSTQPYTPPVAAPVTTDNTATPAAVPATPSDNDNDNDMDKDDKVVEPNPPAMPQATDSDQQPQTPATPDTPTRMPATSAGWLMMLLSGGTLSGIGTYLRRRR